MPSTIAATNPVLSIRHFNRFYTRQFGLLQKRLLGSPYSLVEARVLYELANHSPLTARDIGIDLALDAGYLSRILKRFEESGLLHRERCPDDGRSQKLSLTQLGLKEAAMMADLANQEISNMVSHLPSEKLEALVNAMQRVETALEKSEQRSHSVVIRSHQPGDIGWVIETHGHLYREEYGFTERFEALVTRICANFISDYDPTKEHCWIAEVDGKRVGCIFLVREKDAVAKLRLLLVTPEARGLGIGKSLVSECINFARRANYKSVVLWTNAVLLTARHVYENAGFKLINEEISNEFGAPQKAQSWQLEL